MDKFRQNWVSKIAAKCSIDCMNYIKMHLLQLFSEPTSPSDPIANSPWFRVSNDQQYLEIGTTVQAGTNPHGERMHFWNEMKAKTN